MPVDIKEIHVKVDIDQTRNTGRRTDTSQGTAAGKEAIIAECVEQVMEILKMKTER